MDLVAGAQAFQILGERLKEAGAVGLRRELGKGIRDAAGPAMDAVRAGLRPHMPDRYADVLNADLKLSVSTRVGAGAGAEAGIRINASASPNRSRTRTGRKLKRLEAGLLTHPLFGDREHWYTQTGGMTPRFFAGPITDSAPEMRRAVVDAMSRTADQITGKA